MAVFVRGRQGRCVYIHLLDGTDEENGFVKTDEKSADTSACARSGRLIEPFCELRDWIGLQVLAAQSRKVVFSAQIGDCHDGAHSTSAGLGLSMQSAAASGKDWGHRDPLVKIGVLSTRRKDELLRLFRRRRSFGFESRPVAGQQVQIDPVFLDAADGVAEILIG